MADSDPDRPLPARDPFHDELRLLLAPRRNPAEAPGPLRNPALDVRAMARIARMLNSIVG
jgi:hypothetical protein